MHVDLVAAKILHLHCCHHAKLADADDASAAAH